VALDKRAPEAKKAWTCRSERRRSPAERQNPQGETLEKGEALELMAACMTRNMKGLTPWVQPPP